MSRYTATFVPVSFEESGIRHLILARWRKGVYYFFLEHSREKFSVEIIDNVKRPLFGTGVSCHRLRLGILGKKQIPTQK